MSHQRRSWLVALLCSPLLANASATALEPAPGREVFWGTPNFSYAEGAVSGKELRELGITEMSHLLYWDQWEVQKGVWKEEYIAGILQRLDQLATAGIRSGIRLGEAHPGFHEWKKEDGKPYPGRNARAYPGLEDTDERYLSYLQKLARTLQGKVDYYVIGDELDMIFGASFRDEERLKEYCRFFIKASKAIRAIDPAPRIVIFPPAWGYPIKNLALLHSWGIGSHADGFALNIPHGDCIDPAYLKSIANEARALSPKYGLYSNGIGYVSDRLPENCQATRLAHIMLAAWEAGFAHLPYYLVSSNAHAWSSGLYREDLENGGIRTRRAAFTFRLLSDFLARKPAYRPGSINIESIATAFGDIRADQFPDRPYLAAWNGPPRDGFGVVRMASMNSPLTLNARLSLAPDHAAMLKAGRVLVAFNAVTGSRETVKVTGEETGSLSFSLPISNEPCLLRWETP